MINLAVEQTDVSMVFEVINDRGVRLRPHEILKGKLLGQIDKTELDKDNYNGLWEEKAAAVNAFDEDEPTASFVSILRPNLSRLLLRGSASMGITTGKCLLRTLRKPWAYSIAR